MRNLVARILSKVKGLQANLLETDEENLSFHMLSTYTFHSRDFLDPTYFAAKFGS